jgi:DNA replication protein DnaC
MIDMLKRHEIQALRRAGHTFTEVAQLSGVSVRTVQRVVAEDAITTVDNVAGRARRESWSYRDVLGILATVEIAHRQQTRLARLSRWAHFPFLKTIDDFNFDYQTSLRLTMLGSALAPDFVTEGRSLIFTGKPGRGKAHLAIAIAYRAIQHGFDAYFTTAATLIDDLSAAFRAGQLAQALATYTHPAILVVDEVGDLTYGTDAANMLFHVVNERHRRTRSLIFTTNKSLKAWGRVLHPASWFQLAKAWLTDSRHCRFGKLRRPPCPMAAQNRTCSRLLARQSS